MAPPFNYATYKQAQEQQQGAQQPTQTANPLAAAAAQEATRQGINAALGGGSTGVAGSAGMSVAPWASGATSGSIGAAGAPATPELLGASMSPMGAATPGLATLATVAVPLIAAYTAMESYKASQKAAEGPRSFSAGVKTGMKEAGPLNFVPLLGQALWLAGGLGGMTASGKGAEQKQRDVIRAALKEKGVLDENWQFNRPNGGFFDLGKEKHMGPNQDQYTYNVWSPQDPMTARTIPLAAIAAANLAPGDRGQFENWNSMITNMATSGVQSYDQVRDNIRAFLRQMGATPESTAASLKQMLDKGVINQQEFDVYQAHNASLLSTAKPYYTNEQAAAPLEAPAATGTTPAGAATPATSPAASTPAATTTQGTTQVPRTETTPSRADAVNGVVNALSSLTSPAQRIQQNVQSRATTPTFMSNFLNKVRG